jgi:glycosyltransferase involved in cell wall biosynthesis
MFPRAEPSSWTPCGRYASSSVCLIIKTAMPRLPDALSLCMIVKNEERNLARCLDSVQGLAGEFIIVDTGSTDQTPAIAAGYGAAVIPFDFTVVDFAAARNHAIAHAHGRWILMLDADEVLAPESAPELEEADRSR